MSMLRPHRRFTHLPRWFLKLVSFLAIGLFLALGLSVPVSGYVTSSQGTEMHSTVIEIPLQLAQEPNTSANSTLYFTTPNYVVSVFPRDSAQLKMNVYNRTANQAEQRDGPTVFRGSLNNDGWVSYESFGARFGQNVIFRASANRSTNQARLEIISQANNALIVQENSTSVTAMNVPSGTTPPAANDCVQNTIVAFETRTFSTRVCTEGGVRKMNVFNKLTQQTDVNGQPATLVSPPVEPYEDWVSYFGGNSYSGIAARYYVRVSGGGGAILQIIEQASGRVLIEEQRIGPLLTNIPTSDIPPGATAPASDPLASAYVAAVFGNEQTLAEVQKIYPEAQFQTSRQGRFINAGSFSDRYAAAARVNDLRARGFDARLIFQNVRFR